MTILHGERSPESMTASAAESAVSAAAPSAHARSVLARNNVSILGPDDGPVMVLVHGFGCDQHMYRRILPFFTDRFRVVLFDHVGSGGSAMDAYDPVEYATVDRYAADLLELCDALGLRDITLVGHSVGAMMSISAAVQRPELFSRMLLLAPSPSYIDDDAAGYTGGFSSDDVQELLASLDDNHLAWAAAMAPMIMGAGNSAELAGELETSFCRVDPRVMRTFARVAFLSDMRGRLGEVTVPSLVVQCANDPLAPVSVGRYLHERLAGSELIVLDAAGHLPQVSAPVATAEAMLRYIDATP
ncbi:alpha/beta fold hydrolase [Marisediminicola senii]|uniref:alpha/beta fold hydrolase n=1 Tax=Marisediminicola senii TaxID=2711233 RepID=UPI001F39CBBB|nr:alpha/beta hydrolase [Marisediminicola senii]